jgi:rhodanese-related sulfurtransferase
MTDGDPTLSGIDRLMEWARSTLDRVAPEELDDEVAAGAVVVDTRPVEQRLRDGELPGAVVIDRNVLEWRLDPTCPYRMRSLGVTADSRVILVCNEGYSSSLAAATLQLLALHRATDLVDGFQGWLAHRDSRAALDDTAVT